MTFFGDMPFIFILLKLQLGSSVYSPVSLTYCTSPWPSLYLPRKLSAQWIATWGLDIIFYLLSCSRRLEKGRRRAPLDLPAALAGILDCILSSESQRMSFTRASLPSEGQESPNPWPLVGSSNSAMTLENWQALSTPLSSARICDGAEWLLCSEFPQ